MLSMMVSFLFAAKKTVQFNVMISDNGGKKKVEKHMKKQNGISSVKADAKMGMATIVYDDSETDINAISSAFRSAGFYASPVGENCATKPGGCLNNTPTTTNTMR